MDRLGWRLIRTLRRPRHEHHPHSREHVSGDWRYDRKTPHFPSQPPSFSYHTSKTQAKAVSPVASNNRQKNSPHRTPRRRLARRQSLPLQTHRHRPRPGRRPNRPRSHPSPTSPRPAQHHNRLGGVAQAEGIRQALRRVDGAGSHKGRCREEVSRDVGGRRRRGCGV